MGATARQKRFSTFRGSEGCITHALLKRMFKEVIHGDDESGLMLNQPLTQRQSYQLQHNNAKSSLLSHVLFSRSSFHCKKCSTLADLCKLAMTGWPLIYTIWLPFRFVKINPEVWLDNNKVVISPVRPPLGPIMNSNLKWLQRISLIK